MIFLLLLLLIQFIILLLLIILLFSAPSTAPFPRRNPSTAPLPQPPLPKLPYPHGKRLPLRSLADGIHSLLENPRRQRLLPLRCRRRIRPMPSAADAWSLDDAPLRRPINRFPYTNGHLLIGPEAHKAELEDLSEDELPDLQRQTIEAVKLAQARHVAQGFNIGINLGRCAGAGPARPLHQHVVPRWAGDVNFMSVVGDVRVVPQAVTQLYEKLIRVRDETGIPAAVS